MDILKIEVVTELDSETHEIKYNIAGQIYINDKLVVSHKEYPIDLMQLHTSIMQVGMYDFWTCSCGDAGCAGLWRTIQVKHEQKNIIWNFTKLPFLPDGTFIFDQEMYKNEIDKVIGQTNRIARYNKQANIPFEICPNPAFIELDKLMNY